MDVGIKVDDLVQQNKELFTERVDLFDWKKHNKKRREIVEWLGNPRDKSVGVVADSHIPFHNRKIIRKFLEHSSQFDAIFLIGDAMDIYRLSVFKQTHNVKLQYELNVQGELLDVLCAKSKKVVYLIANHEQRLPKWMAQRLQDGELFSFIRGSIEAFYECFEHKDNNIANQLKGNVRVLRDSWIQYGDVIFCHPDWYSGVAGRTVLTTMHSFNELGLQYNAIFNAHVHKFDEQNTERKHLFEVPCLSDYMDYQVEQKRAVKPLDQGWCWFRFDKAGRFDINSFGKYIEHKAIFV